MNASEGGSGGEISGGLSVGCLAPCHSFTGLVEQWKTSTHYATYIANLGGEEVDSWTGKTACGNCHAIDGIQQRVGGNVIYSGANPPNAGHGQTNYLNSTNSKVAESTYAGHATVAVVHCSTCHDVNSNTDPHVTGKPYVPGSFPLRVPTGPMDQALIEKSSAVGMSTGTDAGKYGRGNVCIWCHKSRKDVTNYITATGNGISNAYWGPHEGPQSDIYTGKGGYHYAGKTYTNSSHQGLANGCLDCHMGRTPTINQGIGDHSFYAQLSTCQKGGCHSNATSFDVLGGQSSVKNALKELRAALNGKGLLTRSTASPYVGLTPTQETDDQFTSDMPMTGAMGLSGDEAGAVYNYLLIVRGSAMGVHNPAYVRQLIYDSIVALGKTPTTLTRP